MANLKHSGMAIRKNKDWTAYLLNGKLIVIIFIHFSCYRGFFMMLFSVVLIRIILNIIM